MTNDKAIVTAETPTDKVLGTRGSDVATSIVKGVLGAIPVVGGAAAEAVAYLIPNQRLDRIERFLKALGERVESFDHDFIKEKLTSPEGIDLLEDCFQGAVRALSEERIQHLANLCATGMTKEAADHEMNKKMVSLLNQLTDAEVIWLAELGGCTDDEKLTVGHEMVLAYRPFGDDLADDEYDAAVIQYAWKLRLIQLGLAHAQEKQLVVSEDFKLDPFTMDNAKQEPTLTPLGQMLLRFICMGRSSNLDGNIPSM